MSRLKFWAYLKNEEGQPIPSASISFKLDDTGGLAKIYSTSVSAANDEIDQSTLTTDVSGFFEFFIGDVYEQGTNRVGYDPDQTFRIDWASPDGRKTGYIDNIQPFYQIFPVDETDSRSRTKNKLASNDLTYGWDSHRQQSWFFEVHGFTTVDKFDSVDSTYSYLVSNKFMNDLKLELEALQVSGSDPSLITIEASAAVVRSSDVLVWTDNTSASGFYYYDLDHSFGTRYPIIQMWCTAQKCQQMPAKIEFISDNTTRIYVVPSEATDKHIIAISESDAITISQNLTFEADLQTVDITQLDANTNIVTDSIVSGMGLLTLNTTPLSATITLSTMPTASLLTLSTETHSITLTGDIVASGAPLPQGIILPYYEYQYPLTLVPTGWKLLSMEGSGGTYIKGTDTDAGTYTSGDLTIMAGSATPTGGLHENISVYYSGFDSGLGTGDVSAYESWDDKAGIHAHQMTGAEFRPKFQSFPLIQATQDNKKIPANCFIFVRDPRSVDGNLSNNMSNGYADTDAYFRYKSGWTNEEVGSFAVSAGGDSSSISTSGMAAGEHTHTYGDIVYEFDTPNATAYLEQSAGSHTDPNVSLTVTPNLKRRILSAWRNASLSVNVSGGMIAMWPSTTPPFGWELCNGNNGTPDLSDHFLVLGAPYFEEDDENGEDGDNTIDVDVAAGTHYWGTDSSDYHTHRGIAVDVQSTSGVEFHGPSSISHSHGHTGTYSSIPFEPDSLKLVFIRKTGALTVDTSIPSASITDDYFTGSLDVAWTESYQTGGSSTNTGTVQQITSGDDTVEFNNQSFSGFYQGPLSGDFDVKMKVSDHGTIASMIGLFAHAGENNTGYGVFKNSSNVGKYAGSGGTGWSSGGNFSFSGTTFYLRIRRYKKKMYAYCSNDGSSWTALLSENKSLPVQPLYIWITVNDDGGTNFTADIDAVINTESDF